ncbi:Fur family transcriptional regulator [Uliginosibacterium paludis]|uniref:Transcriptional repressor n=1 Tax=Uliginosibacterium paludis TaxID=1615952 RepID=A0ABV2CPX5_9RHOO
MALRDQTAAALLQALGLKLSRPRLRVAELMLRPGNGALAMSAEQVYLRLKEEGAGASPGTVYRTLALLESHGALERSTQPDGRHAYALPGAVPQHQMRVADSGKVIRFRDAWLEARLAALAHDSGFEYLKSELVVHVRPETP